MIPVFTIFATALVGLVCIGLPVGALIFLRKRYKTGILSFFLGCCVYVMFALMLEQYCHVLVLKLTSIDQNLFLRALYGGVAAALFEEGGRFLAFKVLMKERRGLDDAIMYGAGHGGIEAFLLMGANMLYFAVLSISYNANPALFSGQENAEIYTAWVQQMQTVSAGSFFYGGYERIMAMILQVCLSILVMTAVTYGRTGWLFISMGVHTAVNCLASLTLDLTQSALLTEVVVTLLVGGAVVLTVWAVRTRWKDHPLQKGDSDGQVWNTPLPRRSV